MTTRTDALESLKRLRSRFGANEAEISSFNEAKTRLLLIDETLVALGWPKDSFNPEERSGKGFTDYLLAIDDRPCLVVEAKRTGHTFTATKKHNKTDYALSYVKSAFGSAFSEVLDQATQYAREHDTPFAVLTNGCEWVIAQLAPAPGQTIDDLKCVYLGNLLSQTANFELLWELLSYDAVASGLLAEHFAELNAKEAEFSQIPTEEFDARAWGSSGSPPAYIEDFYFLFFDEIVDPGRRHMLQHCFVSNAKLDQYRGDLKRVLRDSAPKFLTEATEITPGDGDSVMPSQSGDQAGRVALVVGSVGCGKSTFVHRVLVDAVQKKQLPVLVELIDETDAPNVDSFLWSRVLEQWKKVCPDSCEYEQLVKIFSRQLQELKSGANKKQFQVDLALYAAEEAKVLDTLTRDPARFLGECWRYYRKLGRGIVVFLDNVDRASESFQRGAYSFAHRLARETGATVIVPMREMTYFKGKTADFLDIRRSDAVFHLASPDPVQVISKRISYVEERLDGDHRYRTWKRSEDYEQRATAYASLAETLKSRLLLSRAGHDILELLSAIAWHDVRSLLGEIKRVHVNIGSAAPWTVPLALTSQITAGESSTPTRLPNLYKPSYPTYSCYFIKPRVLALLLYAPHQDRFRHGLAYPELVKFLRLFGYHDRWSRKALEELVQDRLLECLEAPSAVEYTKRYQLDTSHSFRPSPLAVVMFDRIQREPAYLALIGASLPFHSRQHYNDFVATIASIGYDESDGINAFHRLVASKASLIVGKYLATAYRKEQPLSEVARYSPNVAIVEKHLLAQLEQMPGFLDSAPENAPPRPRASQLELNLGATTLPAADVSLAFPPPPDLASMSIGSSKVAPAVFWALVALRADGTRWAIGAEIARLVNEHVFADVDRKHGTNVSRALRSPVLRQQRWLAVHGEPGAWRYGLKANWRGEWQALFTTPAPKALK